MKKERLFYLDFVRAIAAISIIMTHFNARYLYLSPQMPEKAIITTSVSNIYIGAWGVSLFFIISGAALMYSYGEECNLKKFYKKRLYSIYPMFWIAYSIAFLYLFYVNKSVNNGAPRVNIIFSFLGFDGYLAENIPTFYILGEWFLGCIILIYLVFPLLRYFINTHPIALAIVVAIMYACIIVFYDFPFNIEKFMPTRIPEVLVGMYFVKYIKKVNIPMLLISLIVLVLNAMIKPQFLQALQTTYIGIASFFVLVFISKYVQHKIIEIPCNIISKYSYAIFLVHHIVIAQMMSTFDLTTISITESYILFLAVCGVISICSFLLYNLNTIVCKQASQCFLK